MKKLIGAVLALALLLSLSVSAFALTVPSGETAMPSVGQNEDGTAKAYVAKREEGTQSDEEILSRLRSGDLSMFSIAQVNSLTDEESKNIFRAAYAELRKAVTLEDLITTDLSRERMAFYSSDGLVMDSFFWLDIPNKDNLELFEQENNNLKVTFGLEGEKNKSAVVMVRTYLDKDGNLADKNTPDAEKIVGWYVLDPLDVAWNESGTLDVYFPVLGPVAIFDAKPAGSGTGPTTTQSGTVAPPEIKTEVKTEVAEEKPSIEAKPVSTTSTSALPAVVTKTSESTPGESETEYVASIDHISVQQKESRANGKTVLSFREETDDVLELLADTQISLLSIGDVNQLTDETEKNDFRKAYALLRQAKTPDDLGDVSSFLVENGFEDIKAGDLIIRNFFWVGLDEQTAQRMEDNFLCMTFDLNIDKDDPLVVCIYTDLLPDGTLPNADTPADIKLVKDFYVLPACHILPAEEGQRMIHFPAIGPVAFFTTAK